MKRSLSMWDAQAFTRYGSLVLEGEWRATSSVTIGRTGAALAIPLACTCHTLVSFPIFSRVLVGRVPCRAQAPPTPALTALGVGSCSSPARSHPEPSRSVICDMTENRPRRPTYLPYLPAHAATFVSREGRIDASSGSHSSPRPRRRVPDPPSPDAALGWVARARGGRCMAAGGRGSVRGRAASAGLGCFTASGRLFSVHICYVHVLEAFGTWFYKNELFPPLCKLCTRQRLPRPPCARVRTAHLDRPFDRPPPADERGWRWAKSDGPP